MRRSGRGVAEARPDGLGESLHLFRPEEGHRLLWRARDAHPVAWIGANGASALCGSEDQAKHLAGVASRAGRSACGEELGDEALHVDLLDRADGDLAEARQHVSAEVACIP